MDFLKEVLGEELYEQVASKVNEHNGNEANKDKQLKLANLSTGEYVGKGKHDALQALLDGQKSELEQANNLIAELKKGTKGNEELQGKITTYEGQVAELQKQLQEKYKHIWEPISVDTGKNKLLWMIGEVGVC